MDFIRKLDAERICRVCLQEKTDLFLIFDEAYAEKGGAPISVILSECTRYRVERHDELPHQMCGDCMESARSAYRFKRLAEQSYLTLLTVLDVKVRPLHKTNEWADISTQTDTLAIHPCEICGKQFFSEIDVREHRFTDHRGADKNCRVCGESFDHIRKLRSHLSLMHPNEGTMHDIKCPVCQKQFSRKDHMKRHLRIIHKQSTTPVGAKTELVDVDMKYNVSTKTELVEVVMKDESTKTELAPTNLKLDEDDHDWGSVKDDLPDGDDRMEGDIKPKEPQAGSSKTLVIKYLNCSLCSDKFVQKSHLISHMRDVHKPSPETRQEQSADGKKCQVCGETFQLRRMLKRHLAFEHPNEGLTNDMKCLICQRQFSRNEHLKRHLVTVHGENYESTKVSLEEPEIDLMSDVAQREVANSMSTNTMHWPVLDNVAPDSYDAGAMDAINPFSSGDEDNIKAVKKPEINIKVEPTDGFKSDSSDNSFTNDMELDCVANVVKKLKESSDESDDDDNKAIADLAPPKPRVKIIREYLEKKATARRRTGIRNPENRCTECQRTFSRHSHMMRHMLSHVTDAEKPHACPHCGKRFTRSDHLKTHIMNLHQTKEFKCDQCKLAFARNEELTRHIEARHGQDPSSHKIHDCEFCNKKFTSKTYLRKHILLHTDRVYACKFCEQTYKDRTACKDHEKTHGTERKFLCSVCGESFARNDYLRVHMRRHTGEKPYKCQYCGKGFPRATDVKMHERYHTGTKPKVCQLCGKAFHRAYNLTIHMRTHTGERPFKCDQCDKSFTQSNDLKAHTRRHTGERFKCSECDAAFLQLYGLRQHALGAHGIQIESTTGRLQKFPPILLNEQHLAQSLQQLPIEQQQHLAQSLQSQPPVDTLPPRLYTD